MPPWNLPVDGVGPDDAPQTGDPVFESIDPRADVPELPPLPGAGSDDGMSVGALHRFITPTDIRTLKTRVSTKVEAFKRALGDCRSMASVHVLERTTGGVGRWLESWQRYAESPDSWFGTAEQWRHGEAFERMVEDCQTILLRYGCEPTEQAAILMAGVRRPRFVTPGDIRAFKNRLDPQMRALDEAVAACPTLSKDERFEWRCGMEEWRRYFADEESWLEVGEQWSEAEVYEQAIGTWQAHLSSAGCRVPGETIHTGGAALLHLTTPSDVRAVKRRLDAETRALDEQAHDPRIPDQVRQRWAASAGSWFMFSESPESWGSGEADLDYACQYDLELGVWQTVLDALLNPQGQTSTASMATMTVGGLLPRFVTPSDVRDLKNRLDPFVRAVDATVAASGGKLPSATVTGWQAFSQGWRTYFSEDDSWLHTASQMDQGEAYEKDIANWQNTVNAFTGAAPTAPNPARMSGGPDTHEMTDTIKTVAGAAVAVVGGFVLLNMVRK